MRGEIYESHNNFSLHDILFLLHDIFQYEIREIIKMRQGQTIEIVINTEDCENRKN